MKRLADLIIERALRRPYLHLCHADGSFYMGRWWLFQTRWLSARVHRIATPDRDRHFHDHPFSFVSVILRGFYVESRPVSIDPIFTIDGKELAKNSLREQYSIAYRRASDRHSISYVTIGGVWTLVFILPRVQWWGFYTPAGKIYWQDYVRAEQVANEARPK